MRFAFELVFVVSNADSRRGNWRVARAERGGDVVRGYQGGIFWTECVVWSGCKCLDCVWRLEVDRMRGGAGRMREDWKFS